MARKFLEEGKALVDGDPVQASEKFYKAAEEALKIIAVALKLEIVERVEREGRWSSRYYFKAVKQAGDRLGIDLWNLWNAAWVLHVEGFHEMRLGPEEVKDLADKVEALVKLAEALAASRP